MARILIIEDNPANIELMSFLLSAYGHAPLSAADGPRGVAAARSERPDLIACDVNLPGMDGFAVLAELKGDPALAGVPILAVTALAMTGDREKVLAAGFDGYISKPIEPESFVAELEAFLTTAPAPASVRGYAPAAAPATPPAQATDAAAPDAGGRTLLLVDDDRFMLGVLNDMLIGQPYRVLSACSGEEALQVLSHEPVEVILCDQAMPGMRGTEVLAEAAARYPKTVRLMLSGQPDLTDIEAAIKSGVADGHYIKPLGARALREQLDEAFRLQSARGTG